MMRIIPIAFLPDIIRYKGIMELFTAAVKSGGEIIVRGNMSNKFFNKIYNLLELPGFKIEKSGPVKNNNYKTTNGTPIKGDVYQIILKKR